jgi:hypothetical protein
LPQSLNWALETAISKWPNCEFTTPDGRRFCVAEFGDSILLRVQAASCRLTKKQANWLRSKVAGVILDSEDRPFVFGDSAALVTAWLEWHNAYGVPLSAEEQEMFGVSDPDDSEDSNID